MSVVRILVFWCSVFGLGTSNKIVSFTPKRIPDYILWSPFFHLLLGNIDSGPHSDVTILSHNTN